MTKNVKNKMSELSEEIDRRIKDADKQKPFAKHFYEWWKKLNNECYKCYSEAGQEDQPSISPADAVKWLNDQIKKLHDFLSNYVLKV